MNKVICTIELDQRPCCLQYLSKFNKFLVGTYELFPTNQDFRNKYPKETEGLSDEEIDRDLKVINNRAGKLILLQWNGADEPRIVSQFDCKSNGGVFDFKKVYSEDSDCYRVIVAHANGTCAIYNLNSLGIIEKVEHHVIRNSKMLTSIDLTEDASHEAELKIVGDSEGRLTIVYDENKQIQTTLTEGDSIWQVKSMRVSQDRNIVLVGSENCSWFIHEFIRDSDGGRIVQLYGNVFKDFNAGVTCIVSLDDVEKFEDYDQVNLLLGSYDETLQAYEVRYNHAIGTIPQVDLRCKTSIEGGGIWRVKPLRIRDGSDVNILSRQLMVAAMYAGCFVVDLNLKRTSQRYDKMESIKPELHSLISIDGLSRKQKPLYYNIDVSSCQTLCCIVDFNNSLCLFTKIVREAG